MNTVVPQAWIIQEKKRREEERRKEENEGSSIPVNLPKDLEPDSEYAEHITHDQGTSPKSTVIVIEL